MKVLYIGDVMGEPGIRAVERVLPELVATEHIDVVLAQSENVTDGKGMSVADYERLRNAGVHVFTGGNHTPVRNELYPLLTDAEAPVIGPANLMVCPGPGHKVLEINGRAILAVSILGDIVGRQADSHNENPLKAIDSILAKTPRDSYLASIVNIHGDFSSEKVVFAHYLDGRASLVVGDHWHVPTSDAEILPRGTGRITDVGMTGSLDSSLGVKYDSIIPRWRDGVQTRNELETEGRMQFCAVVAEINEQNGETISIWPIRKVWQ